MYITDEKTEYVGTDKYLYPYSPYISIMCPPMFGHKVLKDILEGNHDKNSDLCYFKDGDKEDAGLRVYTKLFLIEMIGTFILVSAILKIKEHTCQLRQMTSYEAHQALG